MYEPDSWEEYEEGLNRALEEIGNQGARWYLAAYGDSISERVSGSLATARELLDAGYSGPALVCAVTALELTIRFWLLRPLLQGAFLSEEWADILGDRFATGSRTEEDRRLLPMALAQWGIRLDKVALPDGRLMLAVMSEVVDARNRVIHRGDTPGIDIARAATQIVAMLITNAVHPIASKLGFAPESGKPWCEFLDSGYPRKVTQRDPFN